VGCFDFLSVAIEFGAYDDFGKPMTLKVAGAGKVLEFM
jgi:hypothetical protein